MALEATATSKIAEKLSGLLGLVSVSAPAALEADTCVKEITAMLIAKMAAIRTFAEKDAFFDIRNPLFMFLF